MRSQRPFTGLIAALLLTAACASSTGMGGPRVLKSGQHEIGIGFDLTLNKANLSPGQDAPAPWPQLTSSYRIGLGGDFELGARTWGFGFVNYFFTFGAGLDLKYGIIQSPDIDSGFDLSIGVAGGYHQVNYAKAPTHTIVTQVPLLLGFNTGGGDQFFFGPRFENQYTFSPEQQPVNSAYGGFSLGYVWRAMPYLEIRPEFVFLYSPVSFNGAVDNGEQRGFMIGQLGFSTAIFWDRL